MFRLLNDAGNNRIFMDVVQFLIKEIVGFYLFGMIAVFPDFIVFDPFQILSGFGKSSK